MGKVSGGGARVGSGAAQSARRRFVGEAIFGREITTRERYGQNRGQISKREIPITRETSDGGLPQTVGSIKYYEITGDWTVNTLTGRTVARASTLSAAKKAARSFARTINRERDLS